MRRALLQRNQCTTRHKLFNLSRQFKCAHNVLDASLNNGKPVARLKQASGVSAAIVASCAAKFQEPTVFFCALKKGVL